MNGACLSETLKVAGTSVTYIEAHYGYIDDQMMKSATMRNFKIMNNGLILRL
jgi:hypothetical protein